MLKLSLQFLHPFCTNKDIHLSTKHFQFLYNEDITKFQQCSSVQTAARWYMKHNTNGIIAVSHENITTFYFYNYLPITDQF